MLVTLNHFTCQEDYEETREEFPTLQKLVFDLYSRMTMPQWEFEVNRLENETQKRLLSFGMDLDEDLAGAIVELTGDLMEDKDYLMTPSDLVYVCHRMNQWRNLKQGLKQGLYREIKTESGEVRYGMEVAQNPVPQKFKAKSLKRRLYAARDFTEG